MFYINVLNEYYSKYMLSQLLNFQVKIDRSKYIDHRDFWLDWSWVNLSTFWFSSIFQFIYQSALLNVLCSNFTLSQLFNFQVKTDRSKYTHHRDFWLDWSTLKLNILSFSSIFQFIYQSALLIEYCSKLIKSQFSNFQVKISCFESIDHRDFLTWFFIATLLDTLTSYWLNQNPHILYYTQCHKFESCIFNFLSFWHTQILLAHTKPSWFLIYFTFQVRFHLNQFFILSSKQYSKQTNTYNNLIHTFHSFHYQTILTHNNSIGSF